MRNNKQGFTIVELLVVLVIIAILAAVATPIYLNNANKARASEAIAALGLIRHAEREYRINNNTYFDVAANAALGNIQGVLPTVVNPANGAPGNATDGLAINLGTTQYFSNGSYTVEASGTGALPTPAGSSGLFVAPPAQDFIISVTGNGAAVVAPFGQNRPCAAGLTDPANCSAKGAEVNNYRLEMDNSGRIFVSYDSGATWAAY